MVATLALLALVRNAVLFEATLTLAKGLPLVEVPVQGRRLTWIVDTGAGRSVLDLACAQSLGLESKGSLPAIGTAGTASAAVLGDVGLSLGEATVKVPAVGLDLSALGAQLGTRFDGVLGYEFFLGRVVEIDYAGKKLRVWESRGFAPPEGSTKVALDLHANTPVIQAALTGPKGPVSGRLLLDTGANLPLTLSSRFVDEQGFETLESATRIGGVGGMKSTRVVDVDQIAIGALVFPRPQALVGVKQGDVLDGAVGSGLFVDRRLFVDYGRKTAWVK